MYLRRVRDQVTRRFGASFAEVGIRICGSGRGLSLPCVVRSAVLEEALDRLRDFLDSQEWILSSCETEVVDVDA